VQGNREGKAERDDIVAPLFEWRKGDEQCTVRAPVIYRVYLVFSWRGRGRKGGEAVRARGET
jgi:hypothetical protein